MTTVNCNQALVGLSSGAQTIAYTGLYAQGRTQTNYTKIYTYNRVSEREIQCTLACIVSQEHKKLLSEITFQGKSGEERLWLSFMRTMEEDIGWAVAESLHFDFFKWRNKLYPWIRERLNRKEREKEMLLVNKRSHQRRPILSINL